LGKVTSSSDAPRHSGIPDKGLPFHSTIELHEAMHEKLYQKRRWGWLQIFVTVIAVLLFANAMLSTCNTVSPRANQSASIGNCKQIVYALSLYAAEHGGKYPDMTEPAPTTSNQAFRTLIREGVLEDDRIFGCKVSIYSPDLNIGIPPDYVEALKAGENHWAMTKGATNESQVLMPLVFENPKIPSWPPVWDASTEGKPGKGRVWRGGKIIVGFNDTSVRTIKVDRATGKPSPENGSSKDVFTHAAPSMGVLDIVE
jgi:hypothetical protein